MPKIVELFFNKSQISPDGSKTSSSVILSTMKSMAIPISGRCFLLSLGARPVLPMIVALEAIFESFSSIGSSVLLSQLRSSCIDFVGCATNGPDGSSPRGYSQFFLFGYRLKDICSFLSFHRHILQNFLVSFLFRRIGDLMLLTRVAPEAMSGFLLETIIVSGLVCLTYNFIDFTRYL
jgi:hypothetical protein